jgi:hypothetical protein
VNAQNLVYEGYELVAQAAQNARGAWYATVTVRQDGVSIAVLDGDTTQPEWLTADEALRDGIDRGRAFVEHRKHGANR